MATTARRKRLMLRCPFYGCRWPEHTSTLTAVGGDECGLDFEGNNRCVMQTAGRHVNFFSCPVAIERKPQLDAAERLILFELPDGSRQTLEQWIVENR